MAKRGDGGARILKGLNEVLNWTKGNGKMRVTMPGKKAKMKTVDEYKTKKDKK